MIAHPLDDRVGPSAGGQVDDRASGRVVDLDRIGPGEPAAPDRVPRLDREHIELPSGRPFDERRGRLEPGDRIGQRPRLVATDPPIEPAV